MTDFSKPSDRLETSNGFQSDGDNFTVKTSSGKPAVIVNDKTGGFEAPNGIIASNIHPVGAVMQAFLTEKEFQEQMGKDWWLCDGRPAQGTKYAKYSDKIPDCRGRFLRSHGKSAEGRSSAQLRAHQSNATAVNGLKNSSVDLKINYKGETKEKSVQDDYGDTRTGSPGTLKRGDDVQEAISSEYRKHKHEFEINFTQKVPEIGRAHV